MKTSNAIYSISRTTQRGVQEFLTANGFRSTETHESFERLRFTQEEGSSKVKELRSNCRIVSIAKSIILNY